MTIDTIRQHYEMLRHTPPRQVARRLELILRSSIGNRLFAPPSLSPPPPIADHAAGPVFEGLRPAERLAQGWRLHQPWGSLDMSRRFDWALPGEDALTAAWRANLHYMHFLESVDDKGFVELVEDWIEHNPPGEAQTSKAAWAAYALSNRVVVWMQQIATRRTALPDAFVDKASRSIARQLVHLERHLETDVRGNHLIRNIKALIFAGRHFTGPHARRWHRTGCDLLAAELAWQILGDGMHYELSPSYHCQVTSDLLEIAPLLPDEALKKQLMAALEAMVDDALLLTHPDGRIAQFNDSGLHMALPAADLQRVHETIAGAGRSPFDGPFSLPDAGFFGLRAGPDYLVVDCGRAGPDDLMAHAHGDTLTFEWSVGGRRMIVDQGTFQHRAGPRRDQTRATSGHNTVSVDGAEICDFFGAHRCGRRAYPELRAYEPEALGFRLEGSHDGFAHLAGRPRHVRVFIARPGSLRIEDRIEGQGDHEGVGGFLLHPDCRVRLVDGGALVTNGDVAMHVRGTVRLDVEQAEWFPDLLVAMPTTRLRYRFRSGDGVQVIAFDAAPSGDRADAR